MKKILQTTLITQLVLSLLLALTACSGSRTDMQFHIYNQSTATIYRISLGPGSDYNKSDEIILYDNFDDQIPAGSTYLTDAGIPEKKMSGTWTIYVNVKWEESGASTFHEFEMNEDIFGFSMHDLADGGLGIMAHYEPYDVNSSVNDRGDRDNDYQVGEGENDWRGVYDNDGEIFLEIWGFDGNKFDFEFFLPSSSGEKVIRLEGVAEINPDNAKDANFEDVNFYYSGENSIFITNHSDYPLASGLYFSANGNEANEAMGGDSGSGDDGDNGDNAEGDPNLIFNEFYYLDGEFGEPSLYFYSDGTADYDYDDTTIEATYIIEQGEKLVLTVDGETWLILTIVDETTLVDYITDEIYALLD